jgi:hypothetical protein
VKIRYYGALTSAFLLSLSTGAVEASDCGCPPKAVHHTTVHHAVARPAPVPEIHETADAEYAQSYYDYHSSSTVTEARESRESDEDFAPHHRQWARGAHGHWVVAPDDARIRFHSYVYDVAPPQGVYPMNDNDFTGGVGGGYSEAYADSYSGGYRDGYGQMHFGPGQNGPAGYGGNFGGFSQGDYGAERGGVWHGYNMQGGPSGNGY